MESIALPVGCEVILQKEVTIPIFSEKWLAISGKENEVFQAGDINAKKPWRSPCTQGQIDSVAKK